MPIQAIEKDNCHGIRVKQNTPRRLHGTIATNAESKGDHHDPPYMINTKSDGRGKLNPWADYINGAHWHSKWFEIARSKLTNDGCMWAFLNWRSLVTYQKAACDLGWPIESLMVWDKCWIGPGVKGLRPSYELVALFAMPEFKIDDRSLADIQRFKWSSTKPNGHPAEKPIDLMKFIICNSTKEGELIADPFSGSGTTCAAAAECGRDFIGIEQDLQWCEKARKRAYEAKAQFRMDFGIWEKKLPG